MELLRTTRCWIVAGACLTAVPPLLFCLGAWIGWIGFIIGAVIQDPTPFGLTKLMYVILVMAIALVIEMVGT